MRLEYHRFHCAAVFLLLFVFIHVAEGQLQNATSKAWKFGSSESTEFIQIQIAQASGSAMSGTISVKTNGLWQGASVKNFTGIQKKVINFMRFDCSCDDGMQFFGWYWPGNVAGRADDRVAIYFRPIAGALEDEDCFPKSKSIAQEDNAEPVD